MSARTAVLAALALVVAAALAAGLWLWGMRDRERPEFSDRPVAVTVAGRALAIPANALRFVAQRRPGPHDRLDLALLAPDLEGRTAATGARFDAPGQPPDVVWVTIEPHRGDLDAAARLATVYARLFVGEPLAGPDGLTGRHLSAKAGYVGEEVWYEPGVVRPFVVRCWPAAAGEPTATCLHDEAVAGLLVTWRFPRPMLDDWRTLAATRRTRLAAWGVAP